MRFNDLTMNLEFGSDYVDDFNPFKALDPDSPSERKGRRHLKKNYKIIIDKLHKLLPFIDFRCDLPPTHIQSLASLKYVEGRVLLNETPPLFICNRLYNTTNIKNK